MLRIKKKCSFTLLELLLSVSILTIISSTLYSYFYTGKKVYKILKSKTESTLENNHLIYFLKRDILNIINWQNQFMILNASKIYFHIKDQKGIGKIKRVDYSLKQYYEGDSYLYKILRSEYNYPYKEITEYTKPLSSVVVAKKLKDVSFKALAKVNKKDIEEKLEEEKKDEDESDNNEDKQIIYEFKKWKFNNFPIGIEVTMQNDANNTKKIIEYLPQFKFNFKNAPLFKVKKEEELDE